MGGSQSISECCENCQAFVTNKNGYLSTAIGFDDDYKMVFGQCHYNPPGVRGRNGIWPGVMGKDWCAQFLKDKRKFN